MNQPAGGLLSADKAQLALWSALRSGELRDGQFLSMAQLVVMLDCPIAAVREAVKQASTLGFVHTLPKRGVQVMEARPEVIRECLDFRMVLDQEGARRLIADSPLNDLAALRAEHEQMQEQVRADPGNQLSQQAISVDLSLHDYLASGLQNSQLETVYEANRLRMAIIQNARPFISDRIASAMDEHLAIITALQQRDVAATMTAIQAHCDQTQRWWGVA